MRKASLLLPLLPFLMTACPSRDAVVDVHTPKPLPTLVAQPTADKPQGPTGLTPEEESAIDKSVSPCDNFYAYACGGWNKNVRIPDDEDKWMRSFSTIRERNEELLRTILESFSRGEPARASGREVNFKEAQALGDFYASCMDEKGIEDRSVTPLAAHLSEIESIKDKATLATVLGKMHARGLTPVFAVGQQQDFKDASKVVGAIEQAGLGMPEREYYKKTDDASQKLRGKYKEHVARMLALLGNKATGKAVAPRPSDKVTDMSTDPAILARSKQDAETVMKIESLLADVSMTKEDRRDPKKNYHLMSADDLAKEYPAFAWDAYKKELGAGGVSSYNVAQPAFMKAALDMVSGKGVSIAEWKVYLRWQLLRTMSAALPTRFVNEAFTWQSTLRGTAKLAPRWKRCVRAVDGELGEALGRAFVTLTLGEEGKAKVKELIFEVEGAMGGNLDKLAWMDAETKGRAREKLSQIKNKVAYPDTWRTYDGLKVERGHHYENMLAGEAFEVKRQLAKVGKPVDRGEWQMTPPTVNAYYDASMNEMVFPAGILQAPFFGAAQTTATNFGAIGMVMGHELTHGFDDEGRQFDADGNLRDWWSPTAGAEFEKRTSCVVEQYNGYTVLGDATAKVNGKLTLGENIADLGGVKLSYAALAAHLAQRPESQTGSVTPEQRFFLGFAQGWCGAYRPEALRHMIATNPHSPPEFRVNGPLSNLPEFHKAFSCQDGAKMVRKDRCEVW
jgi:endothelin-converting enzyme/putative endopeptidase